MKGKWLLCLFARMSDRSITIVDGVNLIKARISKKPLDFTFDKIKFIEVDHILWSLIAEIFIEREYNPEGFDINPGDTIVDIGAHRGTFVANAARHTNNLVIAVEPDRDNFHCLQKFVKINDINAKLLNVAIGVEEGTANIFRSNINSRHSLIGVDQVTGEKLDGMDTVSVITLKSLLSDIPTVDFLKMDCEGAEYGILMNSDASTLGKIKKIALEYHTYVPNIQVRELSDFLQMHFTEVRVKVKSKLLGYILARNNITYQNI